jgi:predicted metal-dependent peptidase
MKGSENFFRKINVHIIQCDSDVQSDTKITNQEEFDRFMKNGKFVGFGSTDFRPVFTYIDELIAKREFENLKGLIYFTDGYGTYPEKIPDYDVAFVFLSDDLFAPQIPPWAIKLVLQSEDVEQE